MGDLAKIIVGLIIMGDLLKEKGKSGLIVMGTYPVKKNGELVAL
jgi:hypothetical protein